MSRRQFIGTSVIGTVAADRLPGLIAHARESAAGREEGEAVGNLRVSARLNGDWRFKRQVAPGSAVEAEFVGAEKPQYEDAAWDTVHLPHTWDATAENPFTTTDHFHGLGWYRRKLEIPAEWRGRRVWLGFNGVFEITDVWVNGHHVGQHIGGYTTFQFDITDALECGAANLLAVRVNDVLSPFIAPTNETNVADYGGIYRSVLLTVTDPVHIPAGGVRITTEQTGKGVLVQVRTRVDNSSDSSCDLRVETVVTDAQGQVVTALKGHTTAAAQGHAEIEQSTAPLANPHLWSPDSPYLYHLFSTVYDGDRALDRTDTHFGIRFMSYDPARGFMLNGQFINLHGVDRRQDYGFLGDAVPEVVGARDIFLIKSMGANFLRTSHYPQDPAVLDACDRLGILVWEEVPNIKIRFYPPSADNTNPVMTERFPWPLMENLKKQLGEMIARDFNRPSIIIWGFGDDLSGYHYPQDFADLSNTTHELDPTRWTAGRVPPVTDISDATVEEDLFHQHELHPERRYIWNEWGSFGSERGLEGKAYYQHLPADPLADVALSDSDAGLFLEGYLMQFNTMPWLGTAKWCMFDCGEVNAALTDKISDGPFPDKTVTFRWPFNDYLGVCDMWRLPKEGFYFLQSQWTDKPMVHIVGHWTWPGETGHKRRVRVYSDCDTVELFLNGNSLGVRQPATPERVWKDFHDAIAVYKVSDQFNQQPLPGASLRHAPFIWDDVPYEDGTLTAVGHQGSATVRDELRTAGPAVRIKLQAEKESLVADDEDVSFIEADVVDAQGVLVPEARPWIHFVVEGPGRLLGGTTHIDAVSGVAAINVQTIGQPGEIVVTANSPGLDPGFARILSFAKTR
jgi:beta-galactosidase